MVLALGISIITGCGGGSNSHGSSNPPGTSNPPGNPPDSPGVPPGSKIVVTVIAGTPPKNDVSEFEDGYGTEARFWGPQGITVDKQTGILYVTDKNTIRSLTLDEKGYYVDTIADASDGFNNPTGIAVGPDGCIYVADSGNHTIRRINDDYTVDLVAGSVDTPGYQDNDQDLKATVLFDSPTGIVCDPKLGTDPNPPVTLYVADLKNNVIRKVVPFSTTVVSTIAGKKYTKPYSSTDGDGDKARFYHPWGITIDKDGCLYVIDSGSEAIRKLTFDTTTKIYSVSTVYTSEKFYYPHGIAINSSGLYVTEYFGNRVRKITNNGTVYTIADKLYYPDGITSDEQGNLYVADSFHCTILKISFQ